MCVGAFEYRAYWKPGEGFGSLRAGVVGNCEPTNVVL